MNHPCLDSFLSQGGIVNLVTDFKSQFVFMNPSGFKHGKLHLTDG